MTTFEKVLEFTLLQEGAHSNDPDDPGGETHWGISSVYHPGVDPRKMTAEQRAEWYRAEFWGPCKCDLLPSPVAAAVFDFAVNSGPGDAIRSLQRALGVVVDGAIGPKTLSAVYASPPLRTARDVLAWRVIHQSQCPNWIQNRLGWSRRNLDLFLLAADLARGDAA